MLLAGLPPLILPGHVRDDLAFHEEKPLAIDNTTRVAVMAIAGERYELPVTIIVGYATSAVAGNRQVELMARQGDGSTLYRIPAPLNEAASQSITYTWALTASTAYSSAAGVALAPLPPIPLSPGWEFRVVVAGGQAGDAFLTARCSCLIFPTGPERVSTPLLAPIPNHVLEAA